MPYCLRRTFAARGMVLPLALALCGLPFASAQQETAKPEGIRQTPQQVIVIPDGTSVELRFVQEITGKVRRANPLLPPPNGVPEARAGDSVRLVAITNLRIDGRIVIAKGAVAKATITDVVPILYNKHPSEETGLFLQLDSVKSVNDVEIPLRAFRKGKPEHFYAVVKSEHGGVIVHPEKRLRIFGAISNNENDFPVDEKRRNWIPPGSRITAFVHGSATLDGRDVDEAQAQLPASASTATLTIYRIKDNRGEHVSVSCDTNTALQLSEQQYVLVELAPGAHSCQISGGKPVSITTAAGEEYYMHVRPHMLGDWELKPVSVSEGEDGIAGAQMVT